MCVGTVFCYNGEPSPMLQRDGSFGAVIGTGTWVMLDKLDRIQFRAKVDEVVWLVSRESHIVPLKQERLALKDCTQQSWNSVHKTCKRRDFCPDPILVQ